MATDTKNRNSVMGRAALIITTLIWGTSFVVLKSTLDTIPTLYILAYRFSGAAILMLVIAFKDVKELDKEYLIKGAILGVMLFMGYTVQTYGLYYTTPAKNAFLTTTYCILVPFVMWIAAKTRPNKYNIISAFICLIGVGFVSLETDYSINLGDVLTICCGLFYAVHIVLTSKYIKGRSVALLSMIQFASAGLLAWIFALLTDPIPTNMSAGNVWSIVYLCVMCTAVCFVLQTFGQKYTPPSKVAIIMTLESVFCTAFSVIIYHEALSMRLIAGFTLIFAAVLICETKLSFLKRNSNQRKEVIIDTVTQLTSTDIN